MNSLYGLLGDMDTEFCEYCEQLFVVGDVVEVDGVWLCEGCRPQEANEEANDEANDGTQEANKET